MENLTFGKLVNLLKRKFNIIMIFALIGFLVGILYVLIIFKPIYKSTAKLLIKNTDQTAFVTEFGDLAKMTSLGTNTNPLLTQIQVLQSQSYTRKVWQNISQKYNLDGSEKEGAEFIQNAISIKNPAKTDIITITASWNEPEIARDIAQEFANTYINSNINISKQSIAQSKLAIDKQLAIAEANLGQIRNKIQEFKQNNSMINSKVAYIGQLKSKKIQISQQQLTLNNIIQDEANWAKIVNTLKAKQIEANIRISGIVSNISFVDFPTASLYCAFPNRVQLITLFTIFGALFSIAGSIIMTIIKNTYDDVEQMEEELNSTVLGIIPWLDQEDYDESDMEFAFDEAASFYSLAYQKIISGMRIKGHNSNIKALAFTSSEFSKFRSTIIMNTAYSLNKTGQSVVVVDADFRTPSISQEFRLKITDKYNLSELLSEISREKRLLGCFNWEKLNYFIQEIPKTEKFYIIPNAGNVPDPCEFLHSLAFSELIQQLKKKFDWVLIDVPPALAVPDALTVGSSVDGMILVTGLETNKAVLRKIYKQFKNYNISIFGIVARELQIQETAVSNKYMKQLIARMMPQNENLLVEE